MPDRFTRAAEVDPMETGLAVWGALAVSLLAHAYRFRVSAERTTLAQFEALLRAQATEIQSLRQELAEERSARVREREQFHEMIAAAHRRIYEYEEMLARHPTPRTSGGRT